MQNISKTIEEIKNEMGIGENESKPQFMTRRQANLIWYYSHSAATPDAMVAYAKENSRTTDQYRDNLKIFQRLQDQKLHGRKWEPKQPSMIGVNV